MVIVWLLLQSLTVYCQDSVLVIFIDQTRYCITEPQALLVAEVFADNEIHKGTIIDLGLKVETLESKLAIADTISEVKDDIIAVVEKQKELSEKELKRQKRKEFWNKVWSKGKETIIAVSALAAGIGIGVLAE